MQELTIEEIVYFWSIKYKYDHKLHGFNFEDKEEEALEDAQEKREDLKSTYGDLL